MRRTPSSRGYVTIPGQLTTKLNMKPLTVIFFILEAVIVTMIFKDVGTTMCGEIFTIDKAFKVSLALSFLMVFSWVAGFRQGKPDES